MFQKELNHLGNARGPFREEIKYTVFQMDKNKAKDQIVYL